MCAALLSEQGNDITVTLLEKNNKIGKKLALNFKHIQEDLIENEINYSKRSRIYY